MKKKLLNSMRVLLVAAGLCVGQSAWAVTTVWETYKSWTLSALTATELSSYAGLTNQNNEGETFYLNTSPFSVNDANSALYGLTFEGAYDNGVKGAFNTTSASSNRGFLMNGAAAKVIIPDLKQGQRVTITCTAEKDITSSDLQDISRSGTVSTGIVTASGDVTIARSSGATYIASILVENPISQESATVKMTYVDYDNPNTSYGEIAAGSTAETGYNNINNNTVGFGNTGWEVNYITYLQVDASSIPAKTKIKSATLTFDGSGSGASNKSRSSVFGAGYNNSEWSSTMTYNTADKSITTIGSTYTTASKKYDTFETVTLDITDALKNDADRIATVIVYETAADHSYIKNPAVSISYVPAYDITFSETNELSPTITIDETDVTSGALLPDGTYSFTASLTGYDDYVGEFTVDGSDQNIEFTMVRTVYSYTVNAVNSQSEVLKTLDSGSCYAGDEVTTHYPSHINIGGTLYTANAINNEFGVSYTPNTDNYIQTITYTASETTDVIFLIEGEDIPGGTRATKYGNTTRCSGGATAYLSNNKLVTLPKGTYTAVVYYYNTQSGNQTVTIKDGQDNVLYSQIHATNRSSHSEEFTLTETKTLYISGGHRASGVADSGIDLVYITGTPTRTIVGAVDNSTGYLSDMTDKVTLKPGESYRYQFVNHNGNGSDNSKNWVLPVYAADAAEPTVVLRADNFEDKAWANTGCWLRSNESDDVWANFINQMNGATVDMTVEYTAAKILNVDCDITTSGGYSWKYTYTSDYDGSTRTFTGNIDLALSVSLSWAEVLSEGYTSVAATIGDTGWTTFSSVYPLDLSGMTASTGEVTAYYASAVGGESVTMTSTESSAVVAGEGIMLKGTAKATITIPVVAAIGSAISGNKLVGCPTATELTTPNAKYYVLVNNGGNAEFQNLSGSYTGNKVTIPAGKAYLDASESSAKSLTIVFDNETLGISDAKLLNGNTEGMGEKAIYNLSGQRIAAPQKGINIIGGRKVVVK